MIQLLMICCLLGLGSALNQPSTCYVSQSVNSEHKEEVKRIRETLESTLSSLESSLSSVNASLQQLVQSCQEPPSLGTLENPASSCRDIPQDSPSGEYWIQTSSTQAFRVYCDMDRSNCSCNVTEGWMRVANLDMTDPSQQCPDGFRLLTAPLRTCARPGQGCVSTIYQTYGVQYSHVCGQIRGYQFGATCAFSEQNSIIDEAYVDGVSLTHGQSPRQHIWTFAAARTETSSDFTACPCTMPDSPFTGVVPHSFVGQDYFCETASRGTFHHIFHLGDPLWDGQGCGSTSTCCELNNPPWFCKQLPQPTTDDIELRLCGDAPFDNEDTPLELIEIYIH